MLLVTWSAAALACGGFFCDGGGQTTQTYSSSYGLVPVEQNSERILFRVNAEDSTITTFVEVGYQQVVDVPFAWIIPIPEAIDAASVTTESADLFNALEVATAPQFSFEWTQVNYNSGGYGYYDYDGRPDDHHSFGCGCADEAAGSIGTTASGTTGGTATTLTEDDAVQVLSDSVIGPFEIEVITATDAAEFADWLTANGYLLPDDALEPLQFYVDQQMAYLGVKLAPDVPEGPIDTLEFTYPATDPMIPLILTSIASAEYLPIQAYILADDLYGPTNWSVIPDVAPETQPDGQGGTDYLGLVAASIAAYDGQAFALEYAQLSADLPSTGSIDFDSLLTERAYITRWRGGLTPEQMTLDPEFAPSASVDYYSNVHTIQLDYPPGGTPGSGSRVHADLSGWPILPLLGAAWLRRRGSVRQPAD